MKVVLTFDQEEIALEADLDRTAGTWLGPPGASDEEARALTRAALEAPLDFPPLSRAVVPGDSVAVPFDRDVPTSVLRAIVSVLEESGIDRESITVHAGPAPPASLRDGAPLGVAFASDDRERREELAYLATTESGRRVYLPKGLAEADVVLPVGRLGPDARLGRRGPWKAIDPDLAGLGPDEAPGPVPATVKERLAESLEVGWLLGCLLEVGVVPGGTGTHRVLAGTAEALSEAAGVATRDLWTCRADRPGDLVVASVSRGAAPTTFDDLADALRVATKLVEPGGKIALLSRATGEIGAALRRLVDALENEGADLGRAFKGLEGEPDHAFARALGRAQAHASVYLLSGLDEGAVEALPLVALDAPGQVGRLLAQSRSVHFVDRANWTRVVFDEERSDGP